MTTIDQRRVEFLRSNVDFIRSHYRDAVASWPQACVGVLLLDLDDEVGKEIGQHVLGPDRYGDSVAESHAEHCTPTLCLAMPAIGIIKMLAEVHPTLADPFDNLTSHIGRIPVCVIAFGGKAIAAIGEE